MKTDYLSHVLLYCYFPHFIWYNPLYQIIPIVISGRTDTKNMIFEIFSWIYFYFFAMFDNVSWLIYCNPLSKIIKFYNNKKDRVPFWSLNIFNNSIVWLSVVGLLEKVESFFLRIILISIVSNHYGYWPGSCTIEVNCRITN